jgi:hypothetical protein
VGQHLRSPNTSSWRSALLSTGTALPYLFRNCEVNVKLSLGLTNDQAMQMCPVLNQAPRHEDVLVNGGIGPRILNLGTR